MVRVEGDTLQYLQLAFKGEGRCPQLSAPLCQAVVGLVPVLCV